MVNAVRADLVTAVGQHPHPLHVDRVPIADDVERGAEPVQLLPGGNLARPCKSVGRLDVVCESDGRGGAVGPEPWEPQRLPVTLQERVGDRYAHQLETGDLERPCREDRRALTLDQPAAHTQLDPARG